MPPVFKNMFTKSFNHVKGTSHKFRAKSEAVLNIWRLISGSLFMTQKCLVCESQS